MDAILEPVEAKAGTKTRAGEYGKPNAPEPVQAWAWAVGIDPAGHRRVFLPAVITTDEEATVVAYCPCLRGCIAQGKNAKEALGSLQATAEDFQKMYLEEGKSLPLVVRPVEKGEVQGGFIVLEG